MNDKASPDNAEAKVDHVRLLNIDLHNWEFDPFIQQLQHGVVVTPNIDHLIKLQKDREFYQCYSDAEHVVCDSRVIQLLSKVLFPGSPIRAQIAGSDVFPAFCHFHRKNTDKIRVFLLGGTPERVSIARDKLNRDCEAEIVVDCYSPPFGFEHDPDETAHIIERIQQSGATVLAVGVGAPKQEKWIATHREKLSNIALFFAIGATIDFQAGAVQRAPRWMSKTGLEWLYRLVQEPKRMAKRYLVDDLPFFWLVLKQRLGMYRNPWD